MSFSRPLLVLGLILCGSGAWAAPDLSGLVRRGQYRLAVNKALALLARDPDDADLYAVLGVSWSKAGYFPDAAGAFPLSLGSAYYEDQGIEAEADQLRAMGRGREAAALRVQRLLDPSLNLGREVRVWLGMVDDLRAAGDLNGALDVVAMCLAIYPASPMVHATVADVHLDAGDREEADTELILADSLGATMRGHVVHARTALLDGDLDQAALWLDDARMFQNRTRRLAALRAEVLRRQGDPAGAEELLEQPNWVRSEDPEIVAVRILVHTDLGDRAGAEDWARLGREVYADNPEVSAALAYMAQRLP